MYTEEVAKNIFRIPVVLPGSPLRELNSYLVKDPAGSLLIDTGFYLDACRKALFRGLNELGVDPHTVDIFLTHMHPDHAGLAAEIIGKGKRIFISEIDHLILFPTASETKSHPGKFVDRLHETGMPAELIVEVKKLTRRIVIPKNVQFTIVQDGEILCAGGYSFRCVLTPGHTPGHMCLWEQDKRLMFTGDHVLFDITPNITAWAYVRDSLGDYLNSLKAVSKYPVEFAFPGHRKPGNFHVRIRQLLQHHQTRLAEVEELVRQEPGSTVYEIAGQMSWNIQAGNWAEIPLQQKIFDMGE